MQLLFIIIVVIICSFRFQMVLDATTKVFTSAASNQGPSLLSVAREVEDFALRYAETQLNDTNKTLAFEKGALGGWLFQTIKILSGSQPERFAPFSVTRLTLGCPAGDG